MAQRVPNLETDHRLASKLTTLISILMVPDRVQHHSIQLSTQHGGVKQTKAIQAKQSNVSSACQNDLNQLIQTKPRLIEPLQDIAKTPLIGVYERFMKIKQTIKKLKEFHIDKVKRDITDTIMNKKDQHSLPESHYSNHILQVDQHRMLTLDKIMFRQ